MPPKGKTERLTRSSIGDKLSEFTMTETDKAEVIQAIRREISDDLSAITVRHSQNRMLALFNILGTVMVLAGIVWKGGQWQALTSRLAIDQTALAARIQVMENSATGGAREYMAQDRAWAKATDERLNRLESLAMTVSSMQADVVRIKTLLESHMIPEKKL